MMIEFLSDPNWIKPQIDFLLYLQDFRINYLSILDKFFLSVTVFGEFWLPTILCAVVYWCVDSRAGVYLFSLEGFNALFAHLFKMLACVYRPWILDNRIEPSALAVPYAKGYSFPSGHSAMSSSVIGGIAYLLRKKILFSVSLLCLIALVGFSRMWLGVHTPQDVVCGLLLGLCLVFIVNRIINWAEENKNRYLYLLIVINIFSILALIYMNYFNTYRIDYVSGKLLVDPSHLKYITTIVYSYALGLINGCFLCRRFFPFDPQEVSVKRRVIRGIVGCIGVILLLKYLFEYIFMNVIDIKFAILLMFLFGILITLIYPIIFTKIRDIK